MAFDPKTGRLYTGDTGDHVREEINLIERGGNYGYPIFEGTPEGPKYDPKASRNDYIFPEAEYGRAHGNDVAGFHFYRGDQPADLDGHAVFSDYWSGWIGAIDFSQPADGQRPIRWLFWDDNISTLGEHPLTGEIYWPTIARASSRNSSQAATSPRSPCRKNSATPACSAISPRSNRTKASCLMRSRTRSGQTVRPSSVGSLSPTQNRKFISTLTNPGSSLAAALG